MTDLTFADQKLREKLEKGESPSVLIIGGGITGATVFALASAAGLKPWLIEQNDFSSGTSSRSSKMLHGGLRYLASGDIGTVVASAKQKAWFQQALPEHVASLPFIYLHQKNRFPGPRVMHGVLSLYDKIANNKLHKRLDSSQLSVLLPDLKRDQYPRASLYYDALTDDVALVMSMLRTGVAYGGLCANYLAVEEFAKVRGRVRSARLSDKLTQRRFSINTDVIVNAGGAWSDRLHPFPRKYMRPLRGSHLVFPHWKLPVPACVVLQHPKDSRPVYVYPWKGVTVVGCTDVEHKSYSVNSPFMQPEEKKYLFRAVQAYKDADCPDARDIISSWSGVRPIISKQGKSSLPSKEPRHHLLWSSPGLISIAGGKLVTAKLMAEEVMQNLEQQLKISVSTPQKITWQCFQSMESAPSTLEQTGGMAVKNLNDLLLRRTRLGITEGRKLKHLRDWIEQSCLEQLNWTLSRFSEEWDLYWSHWERYYSPDPGGGV